LEKAGRLDKAYASLLYEAGSLCLGAGDYERAIENFERHLEADPASHETMNKLAVCHLAKGRPKAARHFFERALMIQPESEAARIGLEKCMAGRVPAAAG
jgi:tetratricopeptide (TPR) repeat protein